MTAETEALPGAPRAPVRDRETVLRTIYGVVFAVVASLAVLPVGALVLGSFRDAAPGFPAHWTLANWVGIASPGVIETLTTTLIVAISTTVGSMVLGAAMALIVFRTDFRWRGTMTVLLGLSFYFPSFILAMAWIIIASPGGLINGIVVDLLGLHDFASDIYTIPGIIFVMILHMAPFVFLTLRGPILGMDRTFEEAARAAGATTFSMLRKVTLPLLSYALASSGLLTFIMSLEQFGIPVLIGTPGRVTVLATQVYLLCRFSPTDYGLAAVVGLTLSAITAIAIVAQRRLAKGGRQVVTTGKAGRMAPLPLGRWRWAANLLCFGYIALALVVPTIILVYTSVIKYFNANPFAVDFTLRNYAFILQSESTHRTILNTLIVCGVGAAIGVLIGGVSSYFTVKLRPAGARILDMLTVIPFGVPGIVLGLGLLWVYAFLPIPIYGTLAIIMVAYITRFLPYATEAIGARMVQLDASLEEAAWTAGASRVRGVQRIIAPLAAPALQSGYFLLFMAFFREISATILLFTASSTVLSVAIWEAFENANWGLASALSLVATLMMLVLMTGLLWLMPGARTAR